jgi:hypothetical protein
MEIIALIKYMGNYGYLAQNFVWILFKNINFYYNELIPNIMIILRVSRYFLIKMLYY